MDHSKGILQESIRLRQFERLKRGTRPIPAAVAVKDITSGKVNFRLVRVKGVVIDAFPDEMDPKWNCLHLREGNETLFVAVPSDQSVRERLSQLIDAEVTLTGIAFPHYAAQRMFIGPHLELASSASIRIDRPATDPFASPPLENIDHASVADIAALRRRRVVGEVLAVWHGMGGSADSISVFFSVYPFEPDWNWKTHGLQKTYDAMQADLRAKYGTECWQAGIGASREEYFYYPVILGINRAIDWVASRPDVDLRHFRYQDTSQCGGLGMTVVALNRHFTRMYISSDPFHATASLNPKRDGRA